MSALTAVTVQNSLGVSGVYPLPANAVAEQIESVATDIGVDAAKTGMLANAAIIAAVADAVARLGIDRFIVDPVIASQHGDPLLQPDALDAYKELLFPLALMITPNLNEIRLLTGIDVHDRSEMEDAARALHEFGPRYALVKGGHLADDEDAIDVLYDGETFRELRAERTHTPHTHGSGDTLAAATTAALARGLDLPAALAEGKAFVTGAVADAFPLGSGRGPVGHFWRVRDWPDPPVLAAGHDISGSTAKSG